MDGKVIVAAQEEIRATVFPDENCVDLMQPDYNSGSGILHVVRISTENIDRVIAALTKAKEEILVGGYE
jgi:hypothetical protein